VPDHRVPHRDVGHARPRALLPQAPDAARCMRLSAKAIGRIVDLLKKMD
jgi:hypothetical protein